MRYDTTLKDLLRQPPVRLLEVLLGEPMTVVKSLNVEFSSVRRMVVDMLLELADGRLIHIELQAQADSEFAHRMLLYREQICEIYRKVPIQIVLWVGKGATGVTDGLDEEDLRYRYRVVDLREVDGDPLLDSPLLGENLIAILCRLRDSRQAVTRILRRIAQLPLPRRKDEIEKLLIASGLRALSPVVREEVSRMPISIDIHENEFLEEIFQEGREEGLQEGREEGREEQSRQLLRRLLERRFGPLSPEVTGKLRSAQPDLLEQWILRSVDCKTLSEVFE